jgi:hypothetical protein
MAASVYPADGVEKKNWLLSGDPHAGTRSLIAYTLIERCRCSGLGPFSYLRDVRTRLPASTNRTAGQLTPGASAAAKTCSLASNVVVKPINRFQGTSCPDGRQAPRLPARTMSLEGDAGLYLRLNPGDGG